MRYLEPQEILVIHALIVDETGGRHGVRDVGLLLSACARPVTFAFGKEQFVGVFEKAAAYVDSIARNHAFVDGNKRTAIAAAIRFMEINGQKFSASNREIEAFVIRVATKHLNNSDIARWLEKHSS